ncbi:MAG TPA: response regulator [Candidatus Binataceae bacterium]|nr:response regulator [Candidatus Binataceae bacterium]
MAANDRFESECGGGKPHAIDGGLRPAATGTEAQTVLVVEDNVVNRRLAQAQLSALGFAADVVANAQEALAAMARRRYALVLMDCQMPGMDGYQTTAEIRRREAAAAHRSVVVAMTAHARHGARRECLEAGMDDYISKPVEIEALEALLKRWLGTPGR